MHYVHYWLNSLFFFLKFYLIKDKDREHQYLLVFLVFQAVYIYSIEEKLREVPRRNVCMCV